MAIINKDLLSVRQLLEMPLTIPDYQRPYKWQSYHVNQLIDDLLHHRHKHNYRLGTVVLYQNEGGISIVDGQQRLLTLTLLCSALCNANDFAPELLEHEFTSAISINNLQNNMALINSRIDMLSASDLKGLADFLTDSCKLIAITLDDLSESFQFFDSQNARGKDLEPHDLLKAFHLREMKECDNDKQQAVLRWETAINSQGNIPKLSVLMEDYLFSMRCWAKGKSGLGFNKTKVGVFKGVTLEQASYPYVESLKALDFLISHYNQQPMRKWDEQQRKFPFQINQTMINGKRFFEFVEHYINDYKTLFIDDCDALNDLLKVIEKSDGKGRVGDRYVKRLFYCAVLFYYDKFGNIKLNEAADLCFRWSYAVRLNYQRVALTTIDNHATDSEKSIFKWINDAQYHHEVLAMTLDPVTENKATKVDNIAKKLGL